MSRTEHEIADESLSQTADGLISIREQVSAMVDGEINLATSELTVASCEDGDWTAYHLIGDVMRGSDGLRPVSDAFAARMAAALEREPAHQLASESARQESSAKHRQPSRWRQWFAVPTAAVVGAVAAVVWVTQPSTQNTPAQEATLAVASADPVVSPVAQSDFSFDDYLDAHRQHAGPIGVQMVSYVPGVGQ